MSGRVTVWLTIFAQALLAIHVQHSLAAEREPHHLATLERSCWLHASLAPVAQKGYWGNNFPTCPAPTDEQIEHAAKLLCGHYAVNRLYLVYHHELPIEAAERLFLRWRAYCPADVEIVPTLLLRMYDQAQSEVFDAAEAGRLTDFFQRKIHHNRIAVFDVYANRDQGSAIQTLAAKYPQGLIRLGVQPEEKIQPPFVAAVQDTWSGFCHGKSNADWQDRGFGADTLRGWVRRRNGATAPTTWDLIVVAWDYLPTERGAYPGYDDAAKNMPLPIERNKLAAKLILATAEPRALGGFSSDLLILQANSEHSAHDGRHASFYETLKRGEVYRGYYSAPLEEVAAIYRQLKAGKPWQ